MAIDLRSDTVTRPGPGMRRAMAEATVGDDVYGEDPSVNLLQERAAALLGQEAALFVPTGTMANQIAVRTHSAPGDVVIAGRGAHLLRFESGAASALSGVQIKCVGENGHFSADDLLGSIPPKDHHNAPATLVALENTHNAAGGTTWSFEEFSHVCQTAKSRGLKVHLDGARLFNAVTASGIEASSWASLCDSTCFCFSKGLGAPVGSVLCGNSAVIDRAHRFRKMFGGGMRQAGVLAAAALYALDHHIERLQEDHAKAAHLAVGLETLGLRVSPKPETNIVLFHFEAHQRLIDELAKRDILVGAMAPGTIRAVTHLDITKADIDEALQRFAHALAAAQG